MACTYTYKGFSNNVFNSKEELLKLLNSPPFQLEGTESSRAGEVSLAKVKEFLKRIGVDIKAVTGITHNGKTVNANAVSKIMQNLIQVVDGKEDVALTEEAMHFAVEIIKKYNPALYKEMFSRIGQYDIFRTTLHDYKGVYIKDGKPDIVRIKEEAIAKLMVEQFINMTEGSTEKPELMAFSKSFWERIKDWLKALFNKSEYNPFREAAELVDTSKDNLYQLRTKEILESANKNLDTFLIDYLKPFGIRVAEFDNLKEKLGIDSLGVADIMNKLIVLSTNRNIETVPEEFGHFITFLMGKDQKILDLMDSITSWSEYKDIYDTYMPVYKNDAQVRIEAVGKLLAKSLVKNYKAVGTDKSLIQKALDIINDFFKKLWEPKVDDRGFTYYGVKDKFEQATNLADKIALMVLGGINIVNSSIPENFTQVNFDRSLAENPFAKNVIDRFTSKFPNIKLTGSVAIAKQGTIYRDGVEQIHDIDFKATGSGEDLNKLVEYIESIGGVPKHYGWKNDTFVTYTFIIPKEGSKITDVVRNDKNYVESYKVDGKEASGNAIDVDFFWQKENNEVSFEDVSSFNDIFKGKLFLGKNKSKERLFSRPKDQKDYVLFQPDYLGRSSDEFVYYQLNPNTNNVQKETFDKIKDIDSKITKIDDGKGNSHYEIAGIKVPNRVTDIAKSWYDRIFKAGQIGKSDLQKAIDDTKRDKGTDIHLDIQDIFHRYVDDNGKIRPVPLPQTNVSKADPNDNILYKRLEDNLAERLASFPADTIFMSEAQIYDENKKEAGTIDFLAIEKDGTTHILDWKTMEVNTDKYEDIPWYKIEAYEKQIGEYKRILRDRYGIKKFGQTRAIPIQAIYQYKNPQDKKQGIELFNLRIGKVNVSLEDDPFLLPVGLKDESTGDAKVDEAIRKLNFVYKQLSAKPVKGGRKDIKAAQLNALFTAIRQLQMRKNIVPLIQQGKSLLLQMDEIIKRYEDTFKGKTPESVGNEAIKAFSDELAEALDELGVYAGMNIQFDGVFDEKDPEQKKIVESIGALADNSQKKLAKFQDITKEFTATHISGRLGILDLLLPEKVVQGWARLFRSFSQGATAAVRTLYRLENTLRHRAEIEADEENKKLDSIKEEYDKWAKGKGLSVKEYFSPITKKDEKGRYVHEQIDQYNPEFYKLFNEQAAAGNKQWVRDNVDMQAYANYYRTFLVPNKLDAIDNIRYAADDRENEDRKEKEREKFHKTYSLNNDSAWSNPALKKFPQKKWESKEYVELNKKGNEPALALYQYINDKMHEAASSGAIEEKRANRLLPFMRKGTMEKLVFGGKITLGEDLLRSITVDEDDTVYGERDINTGEIKPTIPFFFVRDIGRQIKAKDGSVEYTDYSDVSTDLFKLMKLFNDQLSTFKYRTEVESQAQLLLRTEKLKEHVDTGTFGTIQTQNGRPSYIPGNEKNAEYLEKFIKNRIYGQKYVDSESTDIAVGKLASDSAKKVNKFLHAKILPEDMGDRVVSITKLLDTANRFFQQKVLGLNLTVPISNFFGGSMQTIINSGKYMDKSDMAGAWYRFTSQNFTGEEGKKYAGLIDYFIPLLDNQKYANARNSSVSNITKFSMSDFLMSIQRGSDKMVQYPLSIALMENTMVEDGKLVNIIQHVRKNNDWNKRYEPGKNRKAIEAKVDAEIKELKNTRSLPKVAKIVDDKLVIDGITRNSNTVAEFREFVQQQVKNAVGNSTMEDSSQIKMNAVTNSFMVFKNWIPRLADVRVGELRYQEGTQSWEYGRMRMLAKVLFDNVLKSVGRTRDILKGNEKGIEYLRTMFEKKQEKWLATHGTELKMSEGEFIDLFREGIRMEMKELAFLLGLMGVFFAWKANAPDPDEDDEVKGFYKWGLRAIDKVTQELSFFYNPVSFDSIANGSIFPALGLLTDIEAVVRHTFRQALGVIKGDEEMQEKAKPAKYWMKTFPILKEATTYIAIFNKDLGDSMGIQLSTQARAK